MPTIWNPLDNSDAALTGLTATFNLTRNTFHSVRSNTNKTSGKWMFVCQISNEDLVGGWAIGVGNATADLTSRVGADGNSAGAQFLNNQNKLITYAPHLVTYDLVFAQRDMIAVCLDADLGFVWWNDLTQRSGWTNNHRRDFSGNPSTAFGGTRLQFNPNLGTYIMGSGYCGGVNSFDSLTLNPQCFGYTVFLPFPFQTWDPPTIGFTVEDIC